MSSQQPTQITGVEYAKTPQGLCKIIETVASFIAVLLIGINTYGPLISFFESAAVTSIIVAVILLILYVSGYIDNMALQWNRIQFVFNVLFAIYYLIATSLILDYSNFYARFIIGGVFGLVAVLAHLSDAFFNYKVHPLF